MLVGLKGLAEPHEALRYYCVNKGEFLVWVTTFALCITVGPVYGIGCGVAVALLLVLLRYTVARTVVLGRLPGTTVYRNVARFPMAEEVPGVTIMRFDGKEGLGLRAGLRSHPYVRCFNPVLDERGGVTAVLRSRSRISPFPSPSTI